MYKISEFSKITRLTVKSLRYYDEEGLLKPSCRADNGYRYYNGEDFKKAERIQFLRDLDFGIAQVKEILKNCESEEDLSFYLAEKQEMILRQIQKEKELIRRIDRYLKPKEAEMEFMEYKIERKSFPAITAASMRYQGKYQDMGKYMSEIYKEMKGKGAGEPFCCYYDDDFKEEADIEVCVPAKGFVEGKNISYKQLPPVQKAVCTTHTGSYEELHRAYKALLDFARDHGLTCLTPSRERYLKGPGMIFKGNPNKYVTEIVIPVQ